MIPFTSNQQNIRSPTPKLIKISLIKNPQIRHPVLSGTDSINETKISDIASLLPQNWKKSP